MEKVATHSSADHGWAIFGNVLDFDAVNQYKCALKEILMAQRDQRINTERKDDLDSDRMNQLMLTVKRRKNKVTKAMFKERATGAFEPFKMLPQIPRIEKYLWEYSNRSYAYGAAAMRDRFQFLMCLCGVLRSESLYQADLSDLCDFFINQDGEPDHYHIAVLRIGDGKANKDGNAVFGRVMRHKDPRLCAINALAIYLCMRFDVTGEIESIDFEDNSTWFNKKLLRAMPRRPDYPNSTGNGYVIDDMVPSITTGMPSDQVVNVEMNAVQALVAVTANISEAELCAHDDKPMAVNTYTKKLEKCFKALGIVSKKSIILGGVQHQG